MTPPPSTTPAGRPRLALAGVHGFGAHHLAHITELVASGSVDLVAVCDRKPADPGQLPPGVLEFSDLADLLAAVRVDVVVIATPIPTHLPLAELALRAGADVLLEKPPVTDLAQFEQLRATVAATGQACAVGFQSLGSNAVPELLAMMDEGRLGEIRGISGVGRWVRDWGYWGEAPWTGRRELDGVPVMDGVVANALAHASATALRLARADRRSDVGQVVVDLYRANDIEADDTSVVKVVTAAGLPVTLGLTLCAERNEPPYVEVVGSTGRARFFYTSDEVDLFLEGAATPVRQSYSRMVPLDNLLAHRATGISLCCPLEATGGFMHVMDAVSRTTPLVVGPTWVEHRVDELGERVVVSDVATWIERAAYGHSTFAEAGAPWAVPSATSGRD